MRRMTCLVLLASLWSLPAGAEDLAQTIPVTGPGRLRIELARGSVDVFTHPAPSVHVEAEARGLGASSVRFELVRDGNDVVLRERSETWIEWLSSGPRVSVRLEIPPSLEVVCASRHVLVTRRDAVEISYPTRAIGNALP